MSQRPDLSRTGFTVILFLAILYCRIAYVTGQGQRHTDFGYSGPHGPEHWGEEYHNCVGKHQSPINIEEHNVRHVTLPPLEFAGLEKPREMYISNNGHTAVIQMSSRSEPAYMGGGPLNGTYAFEQLHFHWGENDGEGSEDRINNRSFAMELHAVFYKNEYGSMSRATEHPDGLAVLAFFFEASATNTDNPVFRDVVTALPDVERVGSMVKLLPSLTLNHLLNPDGPPNDRMQNYFTYNGSLTTPPCSEVVTWIDFKHPLYLSHNQVAAFRSLTSSEGTKITHNYRPLQSLFGRLVLYSSGSHPNHTSAWNRPGISNEIPHGHEKYNSASFGTSLDLILYCVCFVVTSLFGLSGNPH